MFRVEFAIDNAAFDDTPGDEVERILCAIAGLFAEGSRGALIYDVNGNRIGEWSAS